MKKLILIATVLFASASFAADKKESKKKTADKPAAVEVKKMDITGGIKWTGYGVGKSHTGDITLKSGFVDMKGDVPTGGEFVLDMESLKTADSAKLQGHLQSPDFFDVKKFTTGQFKITSIEAIKDAAAGAPNYKITGDLTIKDKKHSETFMATITKKDGVFTAHGETEIKDRTQYDIVYNSQKFKAASVLGDKLIEDKIKIVFDVQTKK